jgi:hypothetical protein
MLYWTACDGTPDSMPTVNDSTYRICTNSEGSITGDFILSIVYDGPCCGVTTTTTTTIVPPTTTTTSTAAPIECVIYDIIPDPIVGSISIEYYDCLGNFTTATYLEQANICAENGTVIITGGLGTTTVTGPC